MHLVYNQEKKIFELKNDFADFIPTIIGVQAIWAALQFIANRINSSGNLSQNDAENISKIIEEGGKQKVKEMEIEVSSDVAMGLDLDKFKGVDVTIGAKKKNKCIMKVKYN